MSPHPSCLGDLLASLRATARQESVAVRLNAGALEAVMIALMIRLCTELEQLFRQWQPRGTAHPCARRVTRIAGRPFRPRALRQPPVWDWLVRLLPARGLRPAALPRPQSRTARAHPLRNAPH